VGAYLGQHADESTFLGSDWYDTRRLSVSPSIISYDHPPITKEAQNIQRKGPRKLSISSSHDISSLGEVINSGLRLIEKLTTYC